eukprot:scaffold1938_cov399-Prasinococcus_capsulatus_cf.AAC.2
MYIASEGEPLTDSTAVRWDTPARASTTGTVQDGRTRKISLITGRAHVKGSKATCSAQGQILGVTERAKNGRYYQGHA